MERTEGSQKEPSGVRKFLLKLESFAEVGKFWLKLESLNELEKLSLKLKSVSAESGSKWTIQKSVSGRSVQKQTIFSQTGRLYEPRFRTWAVFRAKLDGQGSN